MYPDEVASGLTLYAEGHSTSLPEHLLDYHDIASTEPRANMMISTFQGQAMVWLARLIGAKRG